MKQYEYLVSEIYPCLQGEGNTLGKPSILLRFQLCNLKCKWCDSDYTHNTDLDKKNQYMSINTIIDKIKTYNNIKHVIFTGGEPTLQDFNPILKQLGKEYSAEVESNATVIPHTKYDDFDMEDYKNYQWNLSPKGICSGNRLNDEAMNFWSELSRKQDKIFFKFVIGKEHCHKYMEETLSIIDKYQLNRNQVYLMPEGTLKESQSDTEWLIEQCIKYNLNYTPRLHIIIYGNKRGV